MRLLETTPMPPQSAQNIEEATLYYLYRYIPTHLKKIERLNHNEVFFAMFESHRYKMSIVNSFEDPRTEAQIDFRRKQLQVTEPFLDKLENEDGRSLFTICHELSHLIFHADFVEMLLSSAARTPPPPVEPEKIEIFRRSEWHAEHGGGAILMPLITLFPLIKACKKSRSDFDSTIETISDKFGVTLGAANSRYNAIQKQNLQPLIQRLFGESF